MLNTFIEKTVGACKEIYNAGEALVDYTIKEVSEIPSAIEKGWNEGLFSSDETIAEETANGSTDAAPSENKPTL